MFDAKNITEFGLYLLSSKRNELLFPDADTTLVYHSDFQNFLES